MQEMEKITRMEQVKKRQPLYLPGDPRSSVYLLKKGRVKIANTAPSGKEVTFEILEPGEVFGAGGAGLRPVFGDASQRDGEADQAHRPAAQENPKPRRESRLSGYRHIRPISFQNKARPMASQTNRRFASRPS